MRYSIERVFHNLRKHCLIYLVIMVNFLIGVGFFVICMNFKITSQELLRESKRRSTEGEVQVSISGSMGSIDMEKGYDYPISYHSYLNLRNDELYAQELEMLFCLDYPGYIMVTDYSTSDVPLFYSTHVYFMNEDLFTYLYGFSRTPDMAYIGEEAYQALRDMEELMEAGAITISHRNTEVLFELQEKYKDMEDTKDIEEAVVLYMEEELYLQNGQLFFGNKQYPIEVVMPLEEETIMQDAQLEPGDPMSDAIILPMEDHLIPASFINDTPNLRNTLLLRYRNKEVREDIVAMLLRDLNNMEERYRFNVDNAYLELKREIDDYNSDIDRWMFLAVSIMLLSGIGCVGSMFLFLDKRRHFLGVSIAYGSTPFRLALETFTEVLMVLLLGGVLGIAISPMLRQMMVYTGELKADIVGIGIMIIIAVIFSVLSVLSGMYAIKVKDIAVTLKGE